MFSMWWWKSSHYRWSCSLLLHNEDMVPSVLSGVNNKCWVLYRLRSYFTFSALSLILTAWAAGRTKLMERNAKKRRKEERLCTIMRKCTLCVCTRNRSMGTYAYISTILMYIVLLAWLCTLHSCHANSGGDQEPVLAGCHFSSYSVSITYNYFEENILMSRHALLSFVLKP